MFWNFFAYSSLTKTSFFSISLIFYLANVFSMVFCRNAHQFLRIFLLLFFACNLNLDRKSDRCYRWYRSYTDGEWKIDGVECLDSMSHLRRYIQRPESSGVRAHVLPQVSAQVRRARRERPTRGPSGLSALSSHVCCAAWRLRWPANQLQALRARRSPESDR